ncbi:MAG: ribonuclease P protein component [Propionibacteriales bacterium]|nr:ribonuclease P protein component [Propionibacteriales bacterium]
MLTAVNRLRRRTDFDRAVRGGSRAGRRTVVVHALFTSETAPPRCGFVVGKAVGSAPTRNTVKRRLRHLMRERMSLLPRGSLLVVRALPAAASAERRVLGAELDAALDRALTRASGDESA